MSSNEQYYCDLCGVLVADPGIKLKRMNGACVTFGYSIGGWGHRKNFVDFSGEVCFECFEEFKEIARRVNEWRESKKMKVKEPLIYKAKGIPIKFKGKTIIKRLGG